MSICANYIVLFGKNNHYGYLNKEVLNNLSNSFTYRPDQVRSIRFTLDKKKIMIETYNS